MSFFANSEEVNKMVLANLGLVRKIANEFYHIHHFNESDREDIISEGTIGLMKAAEMFDGKSAKFSTYASYWIKEYMRKYLYDKAHTVRIPRGTMQKIGKIAMAVRKLEKEYDRPPTLEETAAATGVSTPVIARLLNLKMSVVSLQETCSENETGAPKTYGDIVARELAPEGNGYSEEQIQKVMNLLKKLNASERKIIYLNIFKGKKLCSIAKACECTTANVSQIRIRALAKLKQWYAQAA